MKKSQEKPPIMPDPLPEKPGVVEPIIAAGAMGHTGKERILSDVDGSYTGRPVEGTQPVQDADDL